MKNTIKEILKGVAVIGVVMFLGFVPVAQKELFSLKWKNLGLQMVEAGVIDADKFESLYSQRCGLSEADKKLLYGKDNGELVITEENSGMMLNMLWAFGLANKNPILEMGPMMDERYGGAENFASTGGWTLAKGNAMDHYSMHEFVKVSPDQQGLVEKVSKGIGFLFANPN